jgi:hypothetical protein
LFPEIGEVPSGNWLTLGVGIVVEHENAVAGSADVGLDKISAEPDGGFERAACILLGDGGGSAMGDDENGF